MGPARVADPTGTPPAATGRRAVSPGPRLRIPHRLVRVGLDAAYASLIVALAPWAAIRAALDHKARARWFAYLRDVKSRFGSRLPRASDGPCVWVHGVSVGEVKSAARLVESISAAIPGVEVIISATTDTGYRVARDRYPGRRVEFYPPDVSWIVARALDRLRPDLIVLVESEFWPNFLAAVVERGIPVVLVNGRMSARSASRFRRIVPLARLIKGALTSVCAQLPIYAERFQSLGIPADRIAVTGNLKFDNVPLVEDRGRSDEYARLLGRASANPPPLLVAGSTHPGEERALARVIRTIRASGRPLSAVVAPRHPARADAAEHDLRREGLDVVRRTRLTGDEPPRPEAVVLLDSVGELEAVYSLADVVFVGGSLIRHGGQSMMEPASLGKPVLVGPHIFNFRGEVDLLVSAAGIAVVADEQEMLLTLTRWLERPHEARAIGEAGRAAILASKGATARTIEVLRPLLSRVARVARVARGAPIS